MLRRLVRAVGNALRGVPNARATCGCPAVPALRAFRPWGELLEARHLLATLAAGPAFQNPVKHLDVDHNLVIEATDAVLVRDYLQRTGGATLAPPIGPVDQYYDVSGDGLISRLDLDILVQHLNQRGSFVRSRSLTLESAEGEGGQDPITLALIEPDDAYEGIAFELFGTISPPGYYTIDGDVTAGYSQFPVTTDENGGFSVSIMISDDGPSPGNGTLSDVAVLTMTVWPEGFPELATTESTTVVVHNVDPELDIAFVNYLFGGPEWSVEGAIREDHGVVAIPDRQKLTVDWGDGSEPTVLTDLMPDEEFGPYHRFPSDGGTYTINVLAEDDDTGTDTVEFTFPMYLLDLDNDADNNGEINPDDDPIENDEPGAYVGVNSDDDDEDGIPDMSPLQSAPVENEDDLEPFLIRWAPAPREDVNYYIGWHVVLTMDPAPVWEEYEEFWYTPGWIYTSPDKSTLVPFEDPLDEGVGVIEWLVGTEEVPEQLYLEALVPGVIRLQLELRDPNWELIDADAVVFTALAPPEIDLDIDSDNNGIIDGTPAEEADEMSPPGKIIDLNDDDDNGNGMVDFNDPAPFVDTLGNPVDDPDLVPITIRVHANGQDLTNYRLEVSHNGFNERIWKTQDKQVTPLTFVIGQDVVPDTLYVEGIHTGPTRISLILKSPTGHQIAIDEVRAVVTDLDATAFRPAL